MDSGQNPEHVTLTEVDVDHIPDELLAEIVVKTLQDKQHMGTIRSVIRSAARSAIRSAARTKGAQT